VAETIQIRELQEISTERSVSGVQYYYEENSHCGQGSANVLAYPCGRSFALECEPRWLHVSRGQTGRVYHSPHYELYQHGATNAYAPGVQSFGASYSAGGQSMATWEDGYALVLQMHEDGYDDGVYPQTYTAFAVLRDGFTLARGDNFAFSNKPNGRLFQYLMEGIVALPNRYALVVFGFFGPSYEPRVAFYLLHVEDDLSVRECDSDVFDHPVYLGGDEFQQCAKMTDDKVVAVVSGDHVFVISVDYDAETFSYTETEYSQDVAADYGSPSIPDFQVNHVARLTDATFLHLGWSPTDALTYVQVGQINGDDTVTWGQYRDLESQIDNLAYWSGNWPHLQLSELTEGKVLLTYQVYSNRRYSLVSPGTLISSGTYGIDEDEEAMHCTDADIENYGTAGSYSEQFRCIVMTGNGLNYEVSPIHVLQDNFGTGDAIQVAQTINDGRVALYSFGPGAPSGRNWMMAYDTLQIIKYDSSTTTEIQASDLFHFDTFSSGSVFGIGTWEDGYALICHESDERYKWLNDTDAAGYADQDPPAEDYEGTQFSGYWKYSENLDYLYPWAAGDTELDDLDADVDTDQWWYGGVVVDLYVVRADEPRGPSEILSQQARVWSRDG